MLTNKTKSCVNGRNTLLPADFRKKNPINANPLLSIPADEIEGEEDLLLIPEALKRCYRQ